MIGCCLAATTWGLTAEAPVNELETFVPTDGTPTRLQGIDNNGPIADVLYGVEQGILRAATAVDDLPQAVRLAAGTGQDPSLLSGRWLQVSVNASGGQLRTQTLSFAITRD